MVICGSYMFEFNVSKDMKKKDIIKEVATHLCLTLIFKELKIIVEQGRVVTTLNILFSVASLNQSIGSMYDDLACDEDPHLHCLEPIQQ